MRRSFSAQIGQGVDGGAVDLHLKVAVVAGGAAGGAHLGDGLALVDLVAGRNQDAGAVAVVGLLAVAVIHNDQIAVAPHAAGGPAGEDHGAAIGGRDVGAVGGGNVNAAVVAVGAKDGAVAEVGGNAPVYGPDKVAVGQPGGAHLGAHSAPAPRR